MSDGDERRTVTALSDSEIYDRMLARGIKDPVVVRMREGLYVVGEWVPTGEATKLTDDGPWVVLGNRARGVRVLGEGPTAMAAAEKAGVFS